MIVTQSDAKFRLAAAMSQARRWRNTSLMLALLVGASVLANFYLDRAQAPSEEDSLRALVKP